MVGILDKQSLRPLQKESYTCMAKCCDTAATPAELQQCCASCETLVRTAEQAVQVSMADFQNRLQRGIQRCQDKAQEMLSASPSQKEVDKAQEFMANCAADVAQDYQKQIPKLQTQIIETLKKLSK